MSSTLLRQVALMTLTLTCAGVACGSPTDNSDGGNGSCSITLTGAQAASLDCSVLVTFGVNENTSVLTLINTAGSPDVHVSIGSPGEPTAKTYHITDTGVFGSILVTSGTSLWLAVAPDAASQSPASGSFTLTVSSLSLLTSDALAKQYRAHGSLTATLPSEAPSTATGTVTLNATF